MSDLDILLSHLLNIISKNANIMNKVEREEIVVDRFEIGQGAK